jgi:hypothetical protein
MLRAVAEKMSALPAQVTSVLLGVREDDMGRVDDLYSRDRNTCVPFVVAATGQQDPD